MTPRQIDSLCDDFEAALRQDETVRIEDFLPQVEETQRAELLRELLEVEIQFAAERCPKESAEYLRNTQESLKRRFPDQHDRIQSLFQQIVPLRQIGDYEIIGELGRGGMGIVYKAKHKLLQQTVAVKVLSQAMLDDTQAVGRFRREMQLIGSLAHPNIVRALNAGEVDGMQYLAMEFVDGISLQKLVESKRKTSTLAPALPVIPLGAACEAIRQAALGLQNAHELKLVHRDIKPANLMLDHRGAVKILDLGLGKFAEEHRTDYHSSLTMEGMVVGTVDYISPEQCENSSEVDIRADLYSLGCTLYFLLTGKAVYSGSRYNTMRKKLMGHIVGDVPSIRQVIPNISLRVEAFLRRALAKDPADRFQTPIEFAEALTPLASFDELWTLAGETIPADAAASRTDARPSTPYASMQSSRASITTPVSRLKMIQLFVGLHLLFFAAIVGVVIYFHASRSNVEESRFDVEAARTAAAQAEAEAWERLEQWNAAEAENLFTQAMQIRMEDLANTRDAAVRRGIFQDRINLAVAQWYHGDARRAGLSLQTLLEEIIPRSHLDDNVKAELSAVVSELRADFTLFGGAASGRSLERLGERINQYARAANVKAEDNPHRSLIMWKKAILSALHGRLEQAETLLNNNPLPETFPAELSASERLYYSLMRQLAEAVVYYCQRTDDPRTDDFVDAAHTERNLKLLAFRRQFTMPNSPANNVAMKPKFSEVVIFAAELAIHDALLYNDWDVLAQDISSANFVMANFLRQHPGANRFMRRYSELLVRAAVRLHDEAEQTAEKQTQIMNIVRLIERLRADDTETADMEGAALVVFFLPETIRAEEQSGIVLFYPPEIRNASLYHLPLTRQMIKQPDGTVFPALPSELLKKVGMERASGRNVRVSWDDQSVWARSEDALTAEEYPYEEVLPL